MSDRGLVGLKPARSNERRRSAGNSKASDREPAAGGASVGTACNKASLNNTNVSTATSFSLSTPSLNAPTSTSAYPPVFSGAQPSFSGHRGSPELLVTGVRPFGYSVEVPMASWDWNNSTDFADFATFYEPQGELVQESEHQNAPAQNFTIPLPVVNPTQLSDHSSAVKPRPIGAATSPIQVSPPPYPQIQPSVQAGTKRKAEAEPSSNALDPVNAQGDVRTSPAKRVARSPPLAAPGSLHISEALKNPRGALQGGQSQNNYGGSGKAVSSDKPPLNTNNARRPSGSDNVDAVTSGKQVAQLRKVVEASGAMRNPVLPAGKVFPIQIGSELFRLSGASISADGKYTSGCRGFMGHKN